MKKFNPQDRVSLTDKGKRHLRESRLIGSKEFDLIEVVQEFEQINLKQTIKICIISWSMTIVIIVGIQLYFFGPLLKEILKYWLRK